MAVAVWTWQAEPQAGWPGLSVEETTDSDSLRKDADLHERSQRGAETRRRRKPEPEADRTLLEVKCGYEQSTSES